MVDPVYDLIIGTLVRFNHERNGGPVHRVINRDGDGMVELHDMTGWFAPHLFLVVESEMHSGQRRSGKSPLRGKPLDDKGGVAFETRSDQSDAPQRYHIEAGAPAPLSATHVILAAPAYEKMRADAEDNELNRGRLRLWMEFIRLNCTSPEAREYAGAALNGDHVPEGFEQ